MARPPGTKQPGTKISVNWTIDKEAYNTLLQAKKTNPRRSLSTLVTYAITQTYKDKRKEAERMISHHEQETL